MSDEELRVALGEQRYRVRRPWGHLPPGNGYGLPSQVAVDHLGYVYVYQRQGIPIVVLDPEGGFVTSWGVGVVADAHGIVAGPGRRIYCVDRDAHQILVFDHEGHELFRIGERHRPRFGAPFNHPTDVAIAPDGAILVSDGYGNSCLHRFDAEGRHELSWGEPGSGPGQFSTPHGVWVLDDGRVLACDREHDRIQVFTADGRYLFEWGDLYHPMDVVADAHGHIYVSDQIPRLSRFDAEGRLTGRCRPVLNGGHGIAVDSAGNVYLSEMNPPRVTKLEPIDG
jgi:DNA-binding beta-propeller fold protein YncE